MVKVIPEGFKQLPWLARLLIATAAVASAVGGTAFGLMGLRADAARRAEEHRLAEIKRVNQEDEDRKRKDVIGQKVAEHREAARKALADGDYSHAEDEARKALRLRDADLPSIVYRSRALQQLGRPSEAIQTFEQARNVLSQPSAVVEAELEAEFHTLAGELSEDEGKRSDRAGEESAANHFREALASYDRAIAFGPNGTHARKLRDRLARELEATKP